MTKKFENECFCRYGVWKVVGCSLPTLFVGAAVAKEGAAFLEDNDIFVPDDDDD
jgi:hypothetical protein